MGKIMQFLKKIGVVQSGTTTWSGDASNRPTDFGSDNVVSQPDIAPEVKDADSNVDSTPDSDSSDDSSSSDD